jgi:Ca2+-binding EF-hand superfamily protein
MDYINLPGLVGENFANMAMAGNPKRCVTESNFLTLMSCVYRSSIDSKLNFAFQMYDQNCDGQIDEHNVRAILNEIPAPRSTVSSENSSFSTDESFN